jgi:hypothetical protein
MANSTTHAALPYPVKGARFTIAVPYLDADGDPTDPTTPDTEFSLDNGAFGDCAEEVTTISGSNGAGFITLTGAETNGSLLVVAAKVASGPKNTIATLYPRVLPIAFTGTASAGAAGTITLAGCPAITDLLIGCIVRTTGGTGGGGTGGANNQARVITAYTSGRVATVVPNWETTPDSTTTFEVLLTEASILRYVDLKSIDSNATSGNNATLNLKQLNIVNNAGDALIASSTGSNGKGINASGNGSGQGILVTGGATGNGGRFVGGATSGSGFYMGANGGGSGLTIAATANNPGIDIDGSGTGVGVSITGGGTGAGMQIIGGATSGDGLTISTTSGDGLSITPTAGNALILTANGTSKHGLVVTGGTGGTSDGLKAVAGTGGVPIRGDITGNVTGNLSGSVGSVTGAVGSVTAGVTVATISNNVITSASINDGALTSAKFSSGAFDAVWTVTSRILTAGTNIQLPSNGLVNVVAWTIAITGNITGNLSGSVGSVSGNVGGSVASVVANVNADVVKVDGSAPAATLLKYMSLGGVSGTVVDDAANSSTTFLTDLTETQTDYYGDSNGGNVLVFVNTANDKVQARRVTAYNGGTKFITVESAFDAEPTAGDVFILLGRIEV